MKGLYIHIPFCKIICSYCDFIKKVPYKNEIDTYLEALIKEIRSNAVFFNDIDTIYIGGGTPNLLNPIQLEALLKELIPLKPVEFSIEINPDLYTDELGALLMKYGVNRISLGVQTFNDRHLKFLNRTHSKQMVYSTIDSLRKLGFKNINIDMIYAIPNQRLDELKEDLMELAALKPTHISYYSLILEDNTYLYHQYKYNNLKLIDEELEADMFETIIKYLKGLGFKHYEISSFCQIDFESKHNLKYWQLEEYIGVGLGASGFINNIRTENNRILSRYLANPLYQKTEQEQVDLLQDEMIFGLRKMDGIHIQTINEKYEIDILKYFNQIDVHIANKLLEIKDGYLRLTKEGIFLGNQVFKIFI